MRRPLSLSLSKAVVGLVLPLVVLAQPFHIGTMNQPSALRNYELHPSISHYFKNYAGNATKYSSILQAAQHCQFSQFWQL